MPREKQAAESSGDLAINVSKRSRQLGVFVDVGSTINRFDSTLPRRPDQARIHFFDSVFPRYTSSALLHCPRAAILADLVPPRRPLCLRVRGGFGESHVGPPHPRLPHAHGPLACCPQGIELRDLAYMGLFT